MTPRVAAAVKLDALGTTFGGGPMACAVIEAVIDAIESEHLLANVRRIGALIRERCIVDP
jgi:acetylornithine/N-succinyldiaminopimelate aminotransferase